jgi:Protein of unknown function (DUF1552)
MKTTNWTRRQVLKGAGVALSVPWLETFAPRKAQAAGAVKRYMSLYFPNGSASGYWSPTGSGTAMTLSPILAPLEPNKSKVLVLGNVGNYAPWNGHIEPSHGHNSATAFTGVRASTLAGVNTGNGDTYVRSSISVDQIIANQLQTANGGKLPTPLHSLQVGLSTLDSYTDGLPGPHSRSISWKSNTEPLYKIISPKAVFDRLVAGGLPMAGNMAPMPADPAAVRRTALKKSALDYITESSTALKTRLSKSDGMRMDSFLTSVRTLEARVLAAGTVTTPTGLGCSPLPAPTQTYTVGPQAAGYNRGAHATLMIDLVVMAFQCDITRVVSFMLDDARSDFDYGFLPMRKFTAAGSTPNPGAPVTQYHGLQHTSDTNDGFATISWWNSDRANELATKIAGIKEGTGNAMDGTVITYMSGMHGGNHDSLNLPMALIGSGGGVLKQGQYLNFPGTGKNNIDMHLTIMQKVFGSPLTIFGAPQGAYVGTTGPIMEMLA